MTYTDVDLVRLYADWSEQAYSAAFEEPSEHHVRQFRGWLRWQDKQPLRELHDYERSMLAEYRRQEEAP